MLLKPTKDIIENLRAQSVAVEGIFGACAMSETMRQAADKHFVTQSLTVR